MYFSAAGFDQISLIYYSMSDLLLLIIFNFYSHESITMTLERFGIPISNWMSICLDNTAANMGCNNSIKSRMTTDNPSVYVNECVCHILHNAAVKGAVVLEVGWLI